MEKKTFEILKHSYDALSLEEVWSALFSNSINSIFKFYKCPDHESEFVGN